MVESNIESKILLGGVGVTNLFFSCRHEQQDNSISEPDGGTAPKTSVSLGPC